MSNNAKNKDLRTSDKGSNKNVDKRNISLKWFSIASVVILIAIVLLVDVLFDAILGDKFVFDMSSTGHHTISQPTQDFINSLPSDTKIRIVGLFEKPDNITGSTLEYVCPLLDDYAEKSDGKITVEYIDPAVHPGIINELDPEGISGLEAQTYAVVYNGQVTSVSAYDCFAFDQATGYPTANLVEATFTNAMATLVHGFSYKAYFITGLQEPSHTQLTKVLASIGIDSADLPASTDFSIPADCDLLIINGINIDITEGMANTIAQYLQNGGEVIVAVNFYNNSTEEFTNLNSAMSVMGVAIDPYMLIEQDPSMLLNEGYNYQSLLSITDPFISLATDASVRASYCRIVRPTDVTVDYIKSSPVIVSSDSAVSGLSRDAVFSNAGYHYIGMYSTFDGVDDAPHLYAFGTTDLTSDDYISVFGYNDTNVVFMRNIIRSMFPSDVSVLVNSKPLEDVSLDPTKVTLNSVNVMTIALLVVIPLGLVIAGTVVYNKRKNL